VLLAGRAVAQDIVEDVCYTPSVSNGGIGGSLDYSVLDDGRVEFELRFYNPALHLDSVYLLYGIDRALPRIPSNDQLNEVHYELKVPIGFLTLDGDSSAEFEMRKGFRNFGLMVEVSGPSLGKLQSCGAIVFVDVIAKRIASDRKGEIDF